MKNKRTSQTEIARRLGLSQRTVSKALRNESDISSKTRQLVLSTAREMSYHGDRLTRCLLGGHSQIIGILLPGFSQYLTGILDSLETVLRENGYNIMLARWHGNNYCDEQEIGWLLQYKVDGMIVFPRPEPEEKTLFYRNLIEKDERIVFLDSPSRFKGAGSVYTDDSDGIKQAVKHLITHEHRGIAYLGPFQSCSVALNDRYESYQNTMLEHQLKPRALEVPLSEEDFDDEFYDFLDNHPEISAFCCVTDTTAMKVMSYLEKRGNTIPSEYSIVGYGDDIPHVDALRVPLTTVSQNTTLIGQKAATMCLEMIKGKAASDIMIPTSLIIRKSTFKFNGKEQPCRL